MAADWDPAQYERFKEQRAQPFWDLVDLVRTDGPGFRRCVDLGCGTGELTAAVAKRLRCAEAVGVDSSPSMLAAAQGHAGTNMRFEHGEIAGWTASGDHDLVLSNAALQWVADHPATLARWAAALAPGGQLAVQMPANPDHPSHQSSVAVAHTEPFVSAMGGEPPPDPVDVNVLQPDQYSEILFGLGLTEQHVRLQVYPHVLPSSAHVVEWTRGTSLTRFFASLPDALHEPFVEAYRKELLSRIGESEPYFFAFKRILMWGRRP
ncbi:MAG TPA: methyltransferase domain-containing protein [Ilumatobacter sp.]|jgi:trans-aconitate 2-methyltransferase|nr:methyltransferase domain-containing protein [Ilumatobacter sp.]